EGAHRFVQRLWRLVQSVIETDTNDGSETANLEIQKLTHKTLANVDEMIPALKYNAAVAQIYTLVNALEQANRAGKTSSVVLRDMLAITLQMIAPMMPHLAEECWTTLGRTGMVSDAAWPDTNPDFLVEDTVTLPVQINGKKRGDISVAADASKDDVEQATIALPFVQDALSGNSPRKVIVVPGRIVNVVL
ncbi:MAG: class I tRNA ligase family protein, partial [Pseudomonadota bacterium]